MINADELEWSEEEDESKYLMKSPAREEDFEVPDQENEALGGSNLIDHKRSKVFSGNVSLKWKENAQKPDKDVALDFGLPATFVHSNMAAIEKMGATSTYSLWQLCISRLSMSEKTGLVSVRQLRSEHLLAWLKTKFAFRPAQWNKVLEQFELDDFLSFFSLSNLLVTTFGDCVFEERKGPSRVSRPTCFCSYPACLQQRYEVEGACLPCVNLANEEEEENGEVDAQLRFKLEVLFGRMREELQGKLRVRHVLPILDELQVPYDRHRLPRAFWDYRGDFLLISAEQLLQLVRAIRVQETRHTDPLEHLFTYPLPVWLKEEFKASEILLYQHHFGMIDADKGGSIDAEELQQLFTSLGTTLSLTQAQTLIDEYDIDGGGTVDFVEFLVLIYKVQRGAIDLQDNGIARVLNEAKAQLKVFEVGSVLLL
ncbi:EF-hand domain-containing protein [archaeon]|nr:MAG: EF-hand domain-containing protein [archaeon]